MKVKSEIIEEARSFLLEESYGPLTIDVQNIVDSIIFISGEIINKKDKKIKKNKKLGKKYNSEKERLEKKVKKLEARMFLDSLTRINNRGKFDILLNRLFKSGENFSLLFFDVDYFKKINDTYGHLSGDLVLKELAKNVKTQIKSTDIFARYGGEEFIVVLPGTDINGGKMFSERIRKLIEELIIIDKEGNNINITVSVGVVEKSIGDDINLLLKRADDALYEAKDNGRNRVISIS